MIATKLLSLEDKEDMLAGILTDEALEAHVKAWIEARMENRVALESHEHGLRKERRIV